MIKLEKKCRKSASSRLPVLRIPSLGTIPAPHFFSDHPHFDLSDYLIKIYLNLRLPSPIKKKCWGWDPNYDICTYITVSTKIHGTIN